jgi:ElaB/YqjD/DUF883 family membrane-anchored ribosome-binding protein
VVEYSRVFRHVGFFIFGNTKRSQPKGKHMSTTSDQLKKQAKNVTEGFEEMGETVRDAVQEKLGQVRENASEYYEQERDKVHGVACACEQYLRERPLRSVLVAAGIGWLIGRFWMRR